MVCKVRRLMRLRTASAVMPRTSAASATVRRRPVASGPPPGLSPSPTPPCSTPRRSRASPQRPSGRLWACYKLDEDYRGLRRPGRPHGHRSGQDQIVVVAVSPLVGVVAGRQVDLYAEVKELLAEYLGKLQRGGYLERARLQGRLQGGDEVLLGHPVDAPFTALGVPAVDLHRLKRAPSLGEYVGYGRPHPGCVDHQRGLALKLRAVHEGPYPVGDVRVESVAEPLQVAHVQIAGGRFDHGDRGVVVSLAQVEPHVEAAHAAPPKSGATSSVIALSMTSVAKT